MVNSTLVSWHMQTDGKPPTELGARLKTLRQAKELSLREAARRLGISYSRLRDFETGWKHGTERRAVPSREALAKAADVFEYPLDTLLALAGLPPAEPEPLAKPTRTDTEAVEIAEIYRRLPEPHRRLLLKVARVYKRDAGPDGSRDH